MQSQFKAIIFTLVFSLLLLSCGPSQLFGPIITPSPTITNTSTLTPIPTATITSTPTITPKPPLEIDTDISSPENIPFLSWEYITSQQFVKDLIVMDERGLLPKIPDTAVFITTKDSIVYIPDEPPSTTDLQFTYSGFESLFLPAWPGPYAFNINRRPFVLAGIWSTEFSGEKIYTAVNKWENSDGTNGFLGYIFRPLPTFNLTDLLSGFDNSSYFTVGLYFNKEQKGCEKYNSYWEKQLPEFCAWYWENLEITLAPEIFRRWKKTGILSNETIGLNGETQYLLPLAPFSAKYIGPR